MALSYPTIDADNHFYETRDAFTRHIESKYAERTVRVVQEGGEDRILVDGRPYSFSDPKFDTTNPPGSLLEILHDPSKAEYKTNFTKEAMLPAFQDRTARLEMMDAQGIQATVMLPSLAVCVEHPLRHDPLLTAAVLRAFNRYLEDEWGYDYDQRIFGVPLLSLADLDTCCAELERVMGLGARMVHIKAGPVDGRSPADPYFDRFWARLNEAGVPVAFHIGDAGYNELFGTAWGEEPRPSVRRMSAFQWAFMHGDCPIMETLGALVYHNLFGRFPNIKVLSIENGTDWLRYLFRKLDKKKGMGRHGPWLGGYFHGRPSEVLHERLYITAYPEDDVQDVVDFLGVGHLLFGSDYPHPEGLAEPNRFVDLIPDLSEADTRRVMRGNTGALLGLPD